MAIGLRYGIVGTTALTALAVPADTFAIRTIELVSRFPEGASRSLSFFEPYRGVTAANLISADRFSLFTRIELKGANTIESANHRAPPSVCLFL
jgi:hypothetical protein